MANVQLPCTMGTECDYKTPELGFDQAMAMLDRHLLGAHQQGQQERQGQGTAPSRTGKFVRPRLELKESFVDEEVFAFFVHRWSEYKVVAGVKEELAKKELSQ